MKAQSVKNSLAGCELSGSKIQNSTFKNYFTFTVITCEPVTT